MIVFRPIDRWDGRETPHRLPSPFASGWTATAAILQREARAIAPLGLARTPDVIVQLDVTESMIRNDGHLRAGIRLDSPRVVVSIESVHGPLRYQCDRFVAKPAGTSWQANLRAIALGLEALRKVERYGIAGKGEQYTGWTALPSAPAADVPFTYETAIEFVLIHSTALPRATRREHYLSAARHLHPDTGGDTAQFQRLQDAWRLIQGEPR